MRQGVVQGQQQGREEDRQEAAISITLQLLKRRMGEINSAVESQIQALTIGQMEQLSEDLLDFTFQTDLTNWLDKRRNR